MEAKSVLESTAVVASAVGVKPATLLTWYRRGKVPGYRAGLRPVLFNREEVFAALSKMAAKRVEGPNHG